MSASPPPRPPSRSATRPPACPPTRPPTPGAPPQPPGWHGKLPTLGDFASRRMHGGFLATWDDWLARGLLQLQQDQPATWLQAYLASPSWRFLLLPGAMPGAMPGEAGAQAWAGVLMPSVDRVGRYFPFTLVWPLPALPGSADALRTLWAWLARLDELAADALHDDWSVDRLEDELARMALPSLVPAGAEGCAGGVPADLPGLPGAWQPLPAGGGHDIAEHLARQAHGLWLQQAAGFAYWQASGSLAGADLRVSRGLPASAGSLLGATIAHAPQPMPP